MSTTTILILVLIGLFAGILSGFVGVGGGVLIVPALVFFLGLSQHEAQGTSLFVLAMPVVILAVLNYAKSNNVNWTYGAVIATTFVIGGYIGSKLSLKLSPGLVKFVFGLIMAYVSIRLVISGFNSFSNES
ncbi:MAG: sulfite exporter TauE/SafE family protein [Crocinitomicaceae bacterium]|nr:sulfite exporter TauE/SafE family protein [Crocinitomicaceae bacterium]MCF8434809.1 sulfite exporter TauE/SafE family protein [Crocinitomicaceae bacterium]